MPATAAPPVELHMVVEAYEAARRAVGSALVRDYLPPRDDPAYLAALAELIRVDLEYAWAGGQRKSVEEYLAEFPELRGDRARLGEVVFEELRQQVEHGERPDLDEYRAKYGIDTDGWDSIRDREIEELLATKRVDDPKPPSLLTQNLVDVARAYRTFRGVSGSDSDFAASVDHLPANAVRVFQELHASDPAGAGRLAEAMVAFPQVGTDFIGFHLVEELGSGAFGRVFLAKQTELAGRLVALKVAADLTGEPQTLAQLQHTNIVPVYSLHQSGPLQAVCMPYFGSTTLTHVLKDLHQQPSLPGSGKQLISTLNNRKSQTQPEVSASRPASVSNPTPPPMAAPVLPVPLKGISTELLRELANRSYVEAVLWIGGRLADGLGHAHDRGVIHRDLKPANVLLTDEGQPMLLDFNLAENASTKSAATAARVGGTLPYMAPEHLDAFRGLKSVVDARSDLYSLGLILFELLVGQAPYPTPKGVGPQLIPAMREQRGQQPPRLRPLNPAITPAVEAIVRKCLHPEPAKRYQSAKQLQEDIDRHLANRPLKYARNTSGSEVIRKTLRRNKWMTSTWAVLAAAVLSVAAIGGTAYGIDQRVKKLQARNEVQSFADDDLRVARAELGVGTTDPDMLDVRIDKNRQALAKFKILDDPNWAVGPVATRLDEAENRRFRNDVAELLFLTARATALRADRDENQAFDRVRMSEAARLSELAVNCFPADQVPAPIRAQADEFRKRLAGEASELPADPLVRAKGSFENYLAAAEFAAKGRHHDAIKVAKVALEQQPNLFAARFVLALSYTATGQDTKAEAAYDVCVALAPKFSRSYFNRGLVRLDLKNYNGAKADFDAAIRLQPDYALAYLNRAIVREALRNPTGAIEDLTAAIDRGAPPARALAVRSSLQARQGNRAAADADREAILKLEPTDERTWFARAYLQQDKDPEAALASLNKALELNPKSKRSLRLKGQLLAEKLTRPAEAAAALTRLVELYPDSLSARIDRGLQAARAGNREQAVNDAEWCLNRDREPATMFRVAGIYARTSAQTPDDKQLALKWLSYAFQGGYGAGLIERTPEWDAYRTDEEFLRIVEAAKQDGK